MRNTRLSGLACTEIINHALYPIDEPGDPGRQAIIEQVMTAANPIPELLATDSV